MNLSQIYDDIEKALLKYLFHGVNQLYFSHTRFAWTRKPDYQTICVTKDNVTPLGLYNFLNEGVKVIPELVEIQKRTKDDLEKILEKQNIPQIISSLSRYFPNIQIYNIVKIKKENLVFGVMKSFKEVFHRTGDSLTTIEIEYNNRTYIYHPEINLLYKYGLSIFNKRFSLSHMYYNNNEGDKSVPVESQKQLLLSFSKILEFLIVQEKDTQKYKIKEKYKLELGSLASKPISLLIEWDLTKFTKQDIDRLISIQNHTQSDINIDILREIDSTIQSRLEGLSR